MVGNGEEGLAVERGLLFFFFQAEDGIRDRNVTGVQTCALPISFEQWFNESWSTGLAENTMDRRVDAGQNRSEERRVGKEWGARWAQGHGKKKSTKDGVVVCV